MGDASKGDANSQVKDTGSQNHFQCPLLKSTNYTIWSIRIRTILQASGLWEMIEPTPQTQPDDKRDKTALAYLFQALPEDLTLQVANCKTAKEVWDTLKIRNIGVDRVQKARLQTLKSEFEMLQMEEEDSIDSFTTKMTSVISKITSLGTTIDEPTLVRKLLNSVPERFIQIVASIEQYSDLDTMTLDETIGRLKAFEERVKLKKNRLVENQDKLLLTRHNNNHGRGRHFSKQGQGKYIPPHNRNHDDIGQHGKEENPSQDTFKNYKDDNGGMKHTFTRDFSNIKCYNCNKYGHYASYCRERSKRYQRQERSNLIEEDLEPTLLLATSSTDEESKWTKTIHYKGPKSEKGRYDQKLITEEDYDELSMNDQQFEGNIYKESSSKNQDKVYTTTHEDDIKENKVCEKGRKPKFKTHFWNTITLNLFQKIKQKMGRKLDFKEEENEDKLGVSQDDKIKFQDSPTA